MVYSTEQLTPPELNFEKKALILIAEERCRERGDDVRVVLSLEQR